MLVPNCQDFLENFRKGSGSQDIISLSLAYTVTREEKQAIPTNGTVKHCNTKRGGKKNI